MDIQSSKIELIRIILDSESHGLIQKLTALVRSEEGDFWNELSEGQKNEIKKGLEQLDRGNRRSYEDVLKGLS